MTGPEDTVCGFGLGTEAQINRNWGRLLDLSRRRLVGEGNRHRGKQAFLKLILSLCIKFDPNTFKRIKVFLLRHPGPHKYCIVANVVSYLDVHFKRQGIEPRSMVADEERIPRRRYLYQITLSGCAKVFEWVKYHRKA